MVENIESLAQKKAQQRMANKSNSPRSHRRSIMTNQQTSIDESPNKNTSIKVEDHQDSIAGEYSVMEESPTASKFTAQDRSMMV